MPANLHAYGGGSRLPFLPVLANEGYSARGAGTATMFLFFGGGNARAVPDHTGNITVIKYAEPLSFEDGKKGGICSRTGMWAPASQLVTVQGRRIIRDFAHGDPEERK